ncbi:hypothetical protein E4656_15940 [Natronospirillum operosum]|uniref:Transmembrane protein n=1 Tax=Natronospirillum operosum TaxID=2759953 RepID=A0A4Z0W7J6_9GAMM|nr:hypothetical protein [Natronospirillum operosum]TGG91520.1 hypothetical protein E4656_15940 [Natronospirillum operosum]
MSNARPKPGYKAAQLWIVLLTPLVVILASTLLFYSGWLHPEDTTNKGELISPPLDISALGLEQDDRRWWLLTASTAGCDAVCEEQLYWVQQIHIRLGRESPRVSRSLLTAEPVALSQEFPGLHERQGNLDALPMDEPVQLFVVDPNGNVMMKFNSDNSYEDVLDDINTLLSRSTIG